jgi:hypothetical protein
VRVYSVRGAIFILFFVFSSSLEAETFKWVDDNGKEHYSDEPLKDKKSEWVDDEEKSYFSYHPADESTKRKTPRPPSGYTSPKKSRQKNIVRQGYSQSSGGGATASSVSTEGNYTPQTRTPRTTSSRASTRQGSTARTTGVRTTGRQVSQSGTRDVQTSSGRYSDPRESSTRATSGRESSTRATSGRGSSGQY